MSNLREIISNGNVSEFKIYVNEFSDIGGVFGNTGFESFGQLVTFYFDSAHSISFRNNTDPKMGRPSKGCA